MTKKIFSILLSLVIIITIISCNQKEEPKDSLNFGIIPFESAEDLIKNVTPLLNVISEGIGMEVKPYMAADYTGVIEAFRGKKLDVAFLSPASYVMAHKEANVKVILKSQRSGNPYYYGMIIARKDSGINSLNDLKGKKFSFGDPISTSGHVFPKMLLLEKGIKPETDFENVVFSGAHDATVLAVFHKKVDAGATFSDDAEGVNGSWKKYLKPEEAEQLKIIGVSEPIPSDNICVSAELDPKIAEKIAKIIITFGNTEEGKKMMKKLYKFDGYMLANDGDYDSVRKAFALSGIKIEETLKKK